MKVSILGVEYEIKRMTEDEYPKLKLLNASGLAELYSKELIIDKEMNTNTGKEFNNFEEFEKKVLRHEIVHAFFHESGLEKYCSDEELVDFLAIQFSKMKKVFEDANCI